MFGLSVRAAAVAAALIVALIVVVTLGGCPGRQPIDTSQTILVEAGQVMADVDRVAATLARSSEDEAIDRAVARVDAEECDDGEGRESCVVRFLREDRAVWYRLNDAIEAAHDVLEVWESLNDGWRESGDRPVDWVGRVCRPFDLAVTAVLDRLDSMDVEIPEMWRELLGRVDLVCQVGVSIATTAASESEEP